MTESRFRMLMFGGPWLFLFLQPIPHTAALRTLVLIWLLLAGMVVLSHHRDSVDSRSPLLRVIALLVGTFLVASVTGTAPLDSINVVRKDLLAPLLVILVLIATADARRVWLVVITATAAGLAVRTLLVFTEWSLIPIPLRLDSQWVKGYVLDAVIYAPLVIASLAVGVRSKWANAAQLILLLLHFAILIPYESRTGMTAFAVATIIVVAMTSRRRAMLVMATAIVGMLTVAVIIRPELVDRYGAMFRSDSYRGAQGMSARYPIWTGMLQIIEARPILGYGPGWKSIQKVSREDGYVERWRQGSEVERAAAAYFDEKSGSVNPHNQVLHILFDAGVLGLITYSAVWCVFIACVARAWKRRSEDIVLARFSVAGSAFFAAYALMNATNGLGVMPGTAAGMLALAELSRHIGQESRHES